MKRLLSAEDRQRVAQLVTELEKNTAGELVTVVRPCSDSYVGSRAAVAGVTTWALVIGFYLFVPSLPALWVLLAAAPVGFGLWATLGHPSLLRLLVPRSIQQARVHAEAERAFWELGVRETRDRSGVLVYISEAERRVEILADRGIHCHVKTDGWKKIVEQLIVEIRAGRAAQGLCAALERIGAELAANFPARPDDTNELANEVVG